MTAGRWLAGLVLLALVAVSLVPVGPVPPVGPLLDPVHGLWSVAGSAVPPRNLTRVIPGLTHPVDVRVDSRAVPHIFAASEADALRALGYLEARDRLFEMELQWRVGAGRLTELVGADALPVDRASRRIGLGDAARRIFAALPAGSRQRVLLEAFSDGVNARLAELGRRQVPLEYHLLNRRPAPWEPVNSLYLMASMGWTLADNEVDQERAVAAGLVGATAAEALYPRDSPIQEPIQPNGEPAPRFDPVTIPPPVAGSGGEERGDRSLGLVPFPASPFRPSAPRSGVLGSNNWAVGPARSASGHALLAGDPHLQMTLPSIWYEAHLVVPDSLDVYGVTLPGAPAIILGFTRALAWSLTNSQADVLDRYDEVVDDSAAPARYRVDGAWRPLRVAVETYHDGRGRLLATDTLRYTHRGPLGRVGKGWQSLRWTVLEAGNEVEAFSSAARAPDARAWLDSMALFRAPAQNMLVADTGGTIAIRATGRFPLRPGGRGDRIFPGDTSASDWQGDWSLADMPQAVNPAQGFLASANQQPIDPRVDPRYLGADWPAPWRAIRINTLLREDSAVTPDDMRRFQTDPRSAATDVLLPAMLAAAARYPGRDSVTRAARLLAQWDGRYTVGNTRAVLFETTMHQLIGRLWDELAPAIDGGRLAPPSSQVIATLLRDPANPWWDDHRTPDVVEDRDRILADALAAALPEVIARYGEPDAGGWRWDRIRHANIRHLLGIPALSALDIPVQGGPTTLSPSSGSGGHGASWRMVVELGHPVRAWGTYPGGQSGNPASGRYDDRIAQWSAGELDTLRAPATPDGVARPRARLTLEPAGSH